ncbi:MAG: flagellar basal body rod protein FlgB [Desulfatiglans sp.]|jgi:flagellar basal-body rod protein FlgB|nr:flagellar basal body rod protein FlgB [Thermodesulfobacteriota bacterium]MEE4354474.1 flagellar basal body rod protein FlgB [Desulfatiglans sp.]
MGQGLFGGTIVILEKALDLRSLKHNLTVSNIANVDTPNYKAFDMVVEEELSKLNRSEITVEPKRTQPGHLSAGRTGLKTVKSSLSSEPSLTKKGDGNTVDFDRVMASLTENNLMYSALAQIISKKFAGMKDVIQGGNR